jgi:hypothetical protein
MEQNQNAFALAGVADEAPATPLDLSPVGQSDPPSRLDFDPVAVSYRSDGWTPERQRAFIEELADCGVVREAAARVGMTEQSAGRLRRRVDAAAFNLAWESALQIGADRLRSIAWERAVTGVAKPRYYRGELVGEERVYDNRLLIYLLGKAERPANFGAARCAIDDWDRWMAAIEDGLAKPMPRPDETARSPVWEAEDGSWWTNFPPPAGFDGERHGQPGEEEYRRLLTLEERTSLQAWQAREEAERSRRRDVYFARMK